MVFPESHPHGTDAALVMDVVPYMWRWADWRKNGCCTRAWPTISRTGAIMQGMRSTVCPSCRGRGRVEGWRVGSTHAWVDPCPDCDGAGKVDGSLDAERGFEIHDCRLCDAHGKFMGEICFRCAGKKKYRLATLTINPAGIRSTRYAGANEDDDPPSIMIDRMVAGWSKQDGTWWFHRIVVVEYAVIGTQDIKGARLGCSQAFYARTLKLAHSAIQERLEVMFE
jgi:hypothetical protein